MNDETFVLNELNDERLIWVMETCKNHNVGVELYLNGKRRLLYLPRTMSPDKENWLRRKRNTALHFAISTFQFNEKIAGDEALLETKYGLSQMDYVSTPGSIPLFVRQSGEVGCLTITGLAPDEDHHFAEKLLKEIFSK